MKLMYSVGGPQLGEELYRRLQIRKGCDKGSYA